MTALAIVDCHLHIFPPLAGASGFPTAEAHLTHQQRAMHVHGNQPYRRLRDHAVVTERQHGFFTLPILGIKVIGMRNENLLRQRQRTAEFLSGLFEDLRHFGIELLRKLK